MQLHPIRLDRNSQRRIPGPPQMHPPGAAAPRCGRWVSSFQLSGSKGTLSPFEREFSLDGSRIDPVRGSNRRSWPNHLRWRDDMCETKQQGLCVFPETKYQEGTCRWTDTNAASEHCTCLAAIFKLRENRTWYGRTEIASRCIAPILLCSELQG